MSAVTDAISEADLNLNFDEPEIAHWYPPKKPHQWWVGPRERETVALCGYRRHPEQDRPGFHKEKCPECERLLQVFPL